MNARSRKADVVKLRCNACQDFLEMILLPDWQSKLYDIAEKAIAGNKYADNYRPVYEKMRDIGIENYTVCNMDVSLIAQIVRYCSTLIAPVKKATLEALEKIRDDRNLTNHSDENEDDEELYLSYLLSLCNIRSFIKTVDKFETSIDDTKRLAYRRKYIQQIESFIDAFDEERIEIVQRNKDIEKDVNRLRACSTEKERANLWKTLYKIYFNRDVRVEKDIQRFHDFLVSASDAGIPEAHEGAITHYLYAQFDPDKFEKHLLAYYSSYEKLPADVARHIVHFINDYYLNTSQITEQLENVIEGIRKQGFQVRRREDFYWFEQ